MAESAAKPLIIGKVAIPEAMMRRVQQTAQKTETANVTAPVNNPLFKIVFQDEIDPEEKRKQLNAYLTFAGTKAEMRERRKARQEMEDYLEAERTRMQEELMRLTDTDTFSVLQGVLNDMNTDLLTFEEQMKPLTDILDAIYTLQSNGKAIDAFREIQSDKRNEAETQAERDKQTKAINDLETELKTLNSDIAGLGEEKGWFGFGGVKESARKQIAVKQQQIDDIGTRLTNLETSLTALTAPASESKLAEFAAEKDQMRRLLDISGPEHSEKQRSLVEGALKFVGTSKARLGEVREHFTKMSDQMDHLMDANTKMSSVRAILGEAEKDARGATLGQRDEISTPPADESLIRKGMREEKLEAIDEHVRDLDDAIRTNTVAITELTSEAITIRTARDEHNQMLDKTRILHTQGVAGVATRLNTVLNAVSMAALNESSTIAGQTLRRMIENTNEITQKEVVKSAMGIHGMNDDVQTVLDDLATIGETLRASNQIYRTGLADLNLTLDHAREITDTVRADIKDGIAIHSEAADNTANPTGKTNGATPPPAKSASPFQLGAA